MDILIEIQKEEMEVQNLVKDWHVQKLESFIKDLIKKDRAEQLILHGVGVSFIKELIQKETDIRTKLSENLDLYKSLKSMQMYERTFDLWNKQNLVLWDLKDILCRMGQDVD